MSKNNRTKNAYKTAAGALKKLKQGQIESVVLPGDGGDLYRPVREWLTANADYPTSITYGLDNATMYLRYSTADPKFAPLLAELKKEHGTVIVSSTDSQTKTRDPQEKHGLTILKSEIGDCVEWSPTLPKATVKES